MKKVLVDLWFLHDYYDILDYTSVNYRFAYSYEKEYVKSIFLGWQSRVNCNI